MAQLDFSGIDELVERQLLAFLNQANTAKDILQLSLVNQAEQEGKNYGIGPTVASRIISKKRAIPGRRFKELAYLIEGKGIQVLDLPFVINKNELSLYVWTASLYD